MGKGVASIVASVMILTGAIILVGIAYAWFSGSLNRIFSGGLYPQTEDFCANACVIDAGKISRILVPLDGNTVVRAKVDNGAGVGKTYAITYYPNFTPELSLIAATPTIFVPAGETGFAEVTIKGLIMRNSDVNFNITVVNVNDNRDGISFGIWSSISTANVPDLGLGWFLVILSFSAAAVYLRVE